MNSSNDTSGTNTKTLSHNITVQNSITKCDTNDNAVGHIEDLTTTTTTANSVQIITLPLQFNLLPTVPACPEQRKPLQPDLVSFVSL